MRSYPKISDNNFHDQITKIYQKYKIPKNALTIDEYCKPKAFTLQPPQKFLPDYIDPSTPYRSILVYHRIGAGKTCSAIQIGERWKLKRKIFFVLPASLQGNLRNELRSECGGDDYLTAKERKKLQGLQPTDPEYLDIISKSDKRIDKYYAIYSYNKFIDHAKNQTLRLDNAVLIIDEIQNMVSETGTYYKELQNLIHGSAPNLRIVLLSATPMFDRPVELALTMNLLDRSIGLPTGRDFEAMFVKKRKVGKSTYYSVQNMDILKQKLKGYVSYYMGAPPFTFPQMSVRYVECEMSTFQYEIYKQLATHGDTWEHPTKEIVNAADLPNNFYIGERFVSNVVFPNRKISASGLASLTDQKIISSLAKYSCKLDKIISSIRRARGKVFVYSGFKEYAGLLTVIRVLEANGYKNYHTEGIGKKRFAVWSGDQSTKIKDQTREIFNHHDNLYGDNLKIILGSPAIKEGVTLKAVRYVHVLEPYWNQSRLDQVIGRASRFCSHIGLPEDERDVKVYVYVATHPDIKMSVDQHIRKMCETKSRLIKEFERAIKESAVDCRLNRNANQTDDEDPIKCM
jgi:hypothetical protein